MSALQLPTPKLERWKYSNLPAYVASEYSEQPLSVGYDGDDKWVSDADVAVTSWGQDVYGDMQLWNDMQDVFSLHIPKDEAVEKPIHLSLDIDENVKSIGHINIHLEAGSSLTVYEHVNVAGWCNRSMTIRVEAGANLTHIRTGEGAGVVTNQTQVHIDADAKYNAYSLSNYGAFVRDQIHATLNGENGECYLSGAKILNDEQHTDTCILIEHIAPKCYSNQNYRNILNGCSRGVFQGKVHVHQSGQQTDGYQFCNSVLLSERCEMDTKPELEIYADDVKCSHGAVTAQPDAEPLFYLMARGIPKDQAHAMLLQAFVAESLESVEDNEAVHEFIEDKITRSLDA
jgi:Fe-S cluster assembly protein SufD